MPPSRAAGIDEMMTIDVVGMIFEFILRADNSKVGHAVEAVEIAERRSAYLAVLKTELRKACNGLQTEAYLAEFVEHAWLNAIEKAEYQDHELDCRYRALVPEFLWSVLVCWRICRRGHA